MFAPLLLAFMVFPMSAIIIDSQLVDVADDHELRTGERSEVLFFQYAASASRLLRALADSWPGLV